MELEKKLVLIEEVTNFQKFYGLNYSYKFSTTIKQTLFSKCRGQNRHGDEHTYIYMCSLKQKVDSLTSNLLLNLKICHW